jgi:hypothetical protein
MTGPSQIARRRHAILPPDLAPGVGMRMSSTGLLRVMLATALCGWMLTPALATDHAAGERRCGWFENPTPGNATLTDRDGEWEIATQGGHQADGDWPEFSDAQWVETNGHHGYGCACMTVIGDGQAHTVSSISKATARPLSVCRKDRHLHEPVHELDDEN